MMPDRAPLPSNDRTNASSEPATACSEPATQPGSPNDVLRQRAETLAEAPQEALHAADLLEVIVFQIGREAYAIETQFVEEVIKGGAITPVPDAAAVLLGVMNLRGEILAVMDLGLLLSSSRADSGDTWIVVVGKERTEFGLLVDGVSEVTKIRVSDILPPINIDNDSLLRGITSDALLLLDGPALLEDPRLHIDDA